jgi:hypothetical protein
LYGEKEKEMKKSPRRFEVLLRHLGLNLEREISLFFFSKQEEKKLKKKKEQKGGK